MSHFVSPAYHARSLGDVLPAVGASLGLPGVAGDLPSGLHLPEAGAWVVFLIDGLGADLLKRYEHAAPFLSEHLAHSVPGTCGVPSTTATSLTSLGTGLTPGEHGMVGFTSRIPGTDRLLQALAWDKSIDPEQWQPHATSFERLSGAGAQVSVVNKSDFRASGLTRAAHRGGTFVGADTFPDRMAAVLAATSGPRSLTYVYDGDLDKTGHRHGVASTEWLQQLDAIDDEAEQLRDALPSHVRMLVVADHGMVDCPPERHIDVDEHLYLRSGLRLLGGEARFRHLYCEPGATGDVAATWREILGQRATVLTRQQAFDAGWFGTGTDLVLPRIGDLVVACHDDHAIVSTSDFPYEKQMVGFHGSLTPAEMMIPMLVL